MFLVFIKYQLPLMKTVNVLIEQILFFTSFRNFFGLVFSTFRNHIVKYIAVPTSGSMSIRSSSSEFEVLRTLDVPAIFLVISAAMCDAA